MAYDNQEFQQRREAHLGNVTGAAAASLNKYMFFQAAKLKKVHGMVTTAGTHTAAAFDIYVGTASVGSLAFGTNTAGVVVHSAALNTTIPANGYVELKGPANSATLVASVVLEYEVTPDAVKS